MPGPGAAPVDPGPSDLLDGLSVVPAAVFVTTSRGNVFAVIAGHAVEYLEGQITV